MTERLFHLLLRLHPQAFRARFGQEMTDLFRTRLAAASNRGFRFQTWFMATSLIDGTRSIWRERRRVRQGGAASAASFSRSMRDDVRTSLRRIRRSPMLSGAVVALMALTIGSATAVFSVVNAVLLTPLPFGDPNQIIVVWEKRANSEQNVVGCHEYPKWERQNRSFDRMAAMIYNDGAHLTGAGEPKSLLGMRVSAGFFDVMGVQPAIGRAFTPADDAPGAGQVAVLSHRLWLERFGGDAAALGATVRLNGEPLQVIGVMPAGFLFPPGPETSTTDIWTPIAENIERQEGRHNLFVMARLKTGVSIEQAQADMTAVAESIEKEMPNFSRGHGVNLLPLREQVVQQARPSLRLLLGAVIGLVLIGCSNIAGLLFARGLARRREVALELALGASQRRIARQMLAESVLLSVAGGALGLAGATWLTWVLPTLVPPGVLSTDAIGLDLRVLGFSLGLSVLTGVIFGAAPALQLRQIQWSDAIKRGGRTQSGGDRPLFRRVLVAGQIGLAVLLVIIAGLMARGLVALQHVDPGYRTGGLLAIDLSLRGPKYTAAFQQRQFFDDLSEKVRALPGVESVGATHSLPLADGLSGIAIAIEGRPKPTPGDEPAGQYHVVTPRYFETLGVQLLEGRTFTGADARLAVPLIRWWPQQPPPEGFDKAQAMPVAVVNQTMAQEYWPNESPVGRRFTVLFSPMITIVGVVADARNASLRDRPGPEFYLSASQEPQNGMSLIVRTSGEPGDLAPAVRDAVRSLDSSLPITRMRPMDDVLVRTLGVPRFMTALLGAFALMALTLMTAGVYGLVAFMTARRRPEMGIRLALGARRSQVARLILGEGVVLAAIGLVIGIACAIVGGRLIADQLYGVTPTDVTTFVSVSALVFSVVVLACWLPARRASRVDPIIVLRQD